MWELKRNWNEVERTFAKLWELKRNWNEIIKNSSPFFTKISQLTKYVLPKCLNLHAIFTALSGYSLPRSITFMGSISSKATLCSKSGIDGTSKKNKFALLTQLHEPCKSTFDLVSIRKKVTTFCELSVITT